MTLQERRKKPRTTEGLNGSAFIEIRHTFGPVRKSVYKVMEFNEYGISFLMPTSDGYFREGHPLEFSLVTPDLAKVESSGVVRYHHPYYDELGNAFYQVGIETKRTAEPAKSGTFRIRPERLNLSRLESVHAIYFDLENRAYGMRLADISRYSAAFLCSEEEAFQLGNSRVLSNVEITFGSKTLFHGTVVVTRRAPEGEQYRIVVEPRSAVFDLQVIEEQEQLTTLHRSVENLLHLSSRNREISGEYKGLISDARFFLEGYRETLEQPLVGKLVIDAEQEALLDELHKGFYPRFDEFWGEINRVVEGLALDDTEHGVYKSYCQHHLHPLFMAAPFCHRIFFKPLGYPGDYEMMRMIRENLYDGPSVFTKLVNKYTLQIPLAAAARERNLLLADRIGKFVERHASPQVKVLSLASGPALEIQRLIETKPEIAGRMQLTLLDQEVEALRYAQDSIYMKRIMHDCRIQVELVHQNIGAFIRRLSSPDAARETYDLIYIFGLFDYFDDRICGHFIRYASELLSPGGQLLISNFSLDNHHHRTFMEYMFDWYINFRSSDTLRKLGNAVRLPCSISVEEDSTGVLKFLSIQLETKESN